MVPDCGILLCVCILGFEIVWIGSMLVLVIPPGSPLHIQTNASIHHSSINANAQQRLQALERINQSVSQPFATMRQRGKTSQRTQIVPLQNVPFSTRSARHLNTPPS
jgi:hypothetical protein